MSFQLRHSYPAKGSRILSAVIASCSHCSTVRVEEDGEPPHFIKRGDMTEIQEETFAPYDDGRPSTRRRLARVLLEPPCVSPPSFVQEPW